jgi:hypothetical protein
MSHGVMSSGFVYDLIGPAQLWPLRHVRIFLNHRGFQTTREISEANAVALLSMLHLE